MQPLSDHFTNVPAFLTKLWKMVSDSKTDHLICWSSSGNSFIILNEVQFWYELLPLYYKHNNMSSFVRQLNMYGFHKVSSVENGSDGEKDEVQFLHPYFQQGKPELLKLIKRKVTVSRHTENGSQILKGDELSKVLSDVKQLRGRQANVDSQLAAMKQENAVLWRELAVLRQKHTKQQQIVNKLIQFLVSMVHPGNNRMGVGVKRHYPLMLRGSPAKKHKSSKNNNSGKSKNDGPIIHELDNELVIEPEELLGSTEEADKDLPLIYSPSTPSSSTPSIGVLSPISNIELTNDLMNETEVLAEKPTDTNENSSSNNTKESYWDKSSFLQYTPSNENDPSSNELLNFTEVQDEDDPILNILEEKIVDNLKSDPKESKVFINPSSQDTLLSNLTNGTYNIKILDTPKNSKSQSSKKNSIQKSEANANSANNTNMTVATRKSDNTSKIQNGGDLGSILDTNQSELDLYKDILQGCGTLDTNALLGLFNDGAIDYGFSFSNDEMNQNSGDPMVSGQELTTYPILPLEELLDDTLNNANITEEVLENNLPELNTPQICDIEPQFNTDKS